jgi:hypothetical protein
MCSSINRRDMPKVNLFSPKNRGVSLFEVHRPGFSEELGLFEADGPTIGWSRPASPDSHSLLTISADIPSVTNSLKVCATEFLNRPFTRKVNRQWLD